MTDDMKKLGEPITIEGLRGMRGKWVWIVSCDESKPFCGWGLVGNHHASTLQEYDEDLSVRVNYDVEEYGTVWLAYHYQPIATNLQPNCNEPLTIDQLRGMDGDPVLLVFDFEPEPMISLIEYVQDANCIILTNNLGGRSEFYSDEELREYGIKVYAYQPVATDTDVGVKNLTGCPYCKPDAEGWANVFGAYSIHNGMLETGHCKPQKIMYCPHCGTPLNDEARTMLEKRLRGCFE